MNTNNPTVRIPIEHLILVKEFIRHGDAQKADGKAYPKTKPQCLSAAASRLLKRPEIKQLVEEKQAAAMEKGFAAAEAEAAERYKQEFLSIYERRAELAGIVRRQARMNKYYKFKEEVKTMDVPVDNPNAIMRAIELDAKLEAEYFSKKAIATTRAEKKEERKEDGNYVIYIYRDKKEFDDGEDLTDEEYDFLLKESLTNPDITVSPPTPTYMHQKLGCEFERDMETGKYELVCPGDRVLAKEVDGKMKYYDIRENDKTNLTTVNNDSPQTLADHHIEEKTSMGPNPKKHIPNNNPDSYRDQTPIPGNGKSETMSRPLDGQINKSSLPSRGIGSQQKNKRPEPGGQDNMSVDEHGNNWQNIQDLLDFYVKEVHRDNCKFNRYRLLNMNKLYDSWNSPVARQKLEELTGWEYHPTDMRLVRRK